VVVRDSDPVPARRCVTTQLTPPWGQTSWPRSQFLPTWITRAALTHGGSGGV